MLINTLIVAALSTTAPAEPIDLWRGAHLGDTVETVQSRFAKSYRPSVVAILTGGEVSALLAPAPPLDGHPALAHFFFKDGLLNSVQITLSRISAGTSTRNMALAKRISDEISLENDSAFDCGDRSTADVEVYECKWLKAKVIVRLWYMDVAGQAPRFTITYRQVGDPGYDL